MSKVLGATYISLAKVLTYAKNEIKTVHSEKKQHKNVTFFNTKTQLNNLTNVIQPANKV